MEKTKPIKTKKSKPTFESVWASFAESKKEMQEMRDQKKIADEEQRKRSMELDRKIEKVSQTLGGWANNQGAFAEEYFYNSFERKQTNFFGEKFDSIEKNIKVFGKKQDEYDIVLINCKSVGIIEVKYKAHKNDIAELLRKSETFRANFTDYEKSQIYLGLASLAFYPELEQECHSNGIAIIKQVGETVVIDDSCLMAY